MNFIILQNVVTFRINWNNLIMPENFKKHLIISNKAYAKFDKNQESAFETINVISEAFNLETLKNKCNSIIEKYPDTKIITNDEYSLLLAAELRAYFSMPGISSQHIECYVNKDLMKKTIKSVHSPKYVKFNGLEYTENKKQYIDSLIKKLGLPIFGKPIDSAGSENIAFIENREALETWSEHHKDKDNYELDEFITSEELFHCDLVVVDGKIITSYVCRYSYPNAKFIDGYPLGSYPLEPKDALFKEIQEFANKAINDFPEIPDGILHLELFKDKEKFIFLEVGARAPGGMIPQMYENHVGINFEELHFKINLGLTRDVVFERELNAAWIWYPTKKGIIKDIVNHEKISSKTDVIHFYQKGDEMDTPESIRDVSSSMLITNQNYKELVKDYNYLVNEYYPYNLNLTE